MTQIKLIITDKKPVPPLRYSKTRVIFPLRKLLYPENGKNSGSRNFQGTKII